MKHLPWHAAERLFETPARRVVPIAHNRMTLCGKVFPDLVSASSLDPGAHVRRRFRGAAQRDVGDGIFSVEEEGNQDGSVTCLDLSSGEVRQEDDPGTEAGRHSSLDFPCWPEKMRKGNDGSPPKEWK